MAQNSILQNMLKKTIANNKATSSVIPEPVTKTQGTNNNIIFWGQAPEVKPVAPQQQPWVVKAPNPITPTNNVQLQTPYQIPVATKSQPVVELWKPKPAPTPEVQSVNYNPSIYEPYKNYSKDDVANWLDQASVMSSQGKPLSEQDQLIGRYMQRRLQELNTPQTIEDPNKAMIEQTRLDQEAARKRLEEQSNTLYSSEEARIKAYYDKRKADTLAWAERTKQAWQSATSFSGFGRSTFNADQQVQIQKEAEQALAIDQAEMQASLDKYNAQLQWATQEQLAQYDNRIAELQSKSQEFKQKQVEQINAYNAQTAQSMAESIDNLIAFSQQNQPATPLTEEEKQQASAYAQLIVWPDGKVDEGMVKNIPPRLLNEAILQGATIRKSIKPEQEKFGFVNVGDGVIARTNPNTGAVEYTRSWFAKNKAPETVKTDNWTFQYNETTGNYDIPVWSTGWATWDLRWLASQFPWQARAKNNNPAGIKTAISQRTKQLMQDAGVTRSTGTKPPSNESGTYMTFATIEDGLLAHKVLLTQAASDDINARLQQWVGTSNWPNYAREIMSEAWIPNGSKFSQLSEDQLNKLLTVHIKRESPWLYKLMQQPWVTQQVQWWYEPQTAEEEQLLASVSQSKGKKVLPAGTVSMLSDGRALPNLVSDLDKIVTDNESKFWPIAWRIAWWNEYDISGQNIQSKLKLVSQIVGKFMEWWVLRKEDEVKYERMLPTLKDSPDVAKSKIENVKNILEQKYKWYIQDYSNNYDVSWFPIKLFWWWTITPQQTTTPQATQQDQDVNDEDVALFNKYM